MVRKDIKETFNGNNEKMTKKIFNPFQWKSPEDITVEEAIKIFVDVFNDFPKVTAQENTFIYGPRGSGKSMMFRFMRPDCQCLKDNRVIKELDYFSIFIPIKRTDFDKTEFSRLKDQTNFLLNEHLLTMHVAILLFEELANSVFKVNKNELNELIEFFNEVFLRRVKVCGWKIDHINKNISSVNKIFKKMSLICDDMFQECSFYCNSQLGVNSQIVNAEILPYRGPLSTYLNFLYPLLKNLFEVSFLPACPYYLLIDDGDNLTQTQTRILNSWVSSRSGKNIVFKVTSQQMSYKTYRTVSGTSIDTPHDFSVVNISTTYTSSKRKYRDNIKKIVSNRLEWAGIDTTPYKFFPVYKKQEKRIKEIYEAYIEKNLNPKTRGGKNVHDDAYRYSRPDYIKELSGTKKQKSKYYYAGFEQLVHLSSGIVRFFLDSASKMFTEIEKRGEVDKKYIPPTIQNQIARESADDFLSNDFDEKLKDLKLESIDESEAYKVKNLIKAMGEIFAAILLSNAKERRVFSFALSNQVDIEVTKILNLAVRLGYLQKSSIGNKSGTGRTELYIMNRRLAPIYTLDPTSFAGYKFITNEDLKLAISRPDDLIRKFKKKLNVNPDMDLSSFEQLEIFEEL